jgi:DNA repair protein RecN (Recombination protein N)
VLQKISIQNLAIISELEINFSAGLTVLTGETGAGKSIILGSIQLLLGSKADANLVYDKTKKCVVEGVFDITENKQLYQFLIENDFELENNELIIRREISVTNRARAFVNDTPCNVELLKKIGEHLLDLHRQFDTLEIKQTDFQLEVIDTVHNNDTKLNNYKSIFEQWRLTEIQLQKLIAEKNIIKKECDYNKFLLDELQAVDIKENELENIEEELGLLHNAESLKVALAYSTEILNEGEMPITANLKMAINKLSPYSSSFKKLEVLTSRLQACLVELKDVNQELIHLQDHVDIDEQKLNLYLDRFNEGNKLLSKHNVKASIDLVNIKNDLEQKIEASSNVDTQIEELQKLVNKLFVQLKENAKSLSEQRHKTAEQVSRQITKLLPKVGMPGARFTISIENKNYSIDGTDKIIFLFDANNTGVFNALSKVASGGELSRLMLCIKSLMAKAVHLPTLIFDEIDAGISGEVAKQVGTIMQELANKHQIITVTHLPQIAAKAQKHLFVYKNNSSANNAINTHIKTLSHAERVMQIAEMLSGTKPTESAQQAALELMKL